MEGACVFEQKKVIHELTQGIQMAKQLRANLNSSEARDFFLRKILSSYDKALFILKSGQSPGQSWASQPSTSSLPDSSISTESPQSVGFESDQPFVNPQGLNATPKKRKASVAWEDQVRVCNVNGLEGDTNDGHSWRKYGQKDILGTKFPRSYYRCTYSKAQNCLATKQVQRTDEDPKVFEITYKGKHTCNHVVHSVASLPSPEKHEIKPTHENNYQISSPNGPNPSEMLTNLKANLTVNTTDLGASFSFPSTPFGFLNDYQEIHFPDYIDDELLQGYSPSFNTPDTLDWGTSPPMDFLADQGDVYHDFQFNCSFL